MSSNRFDHLTPVERGQDIRSVANSDRINAIQDILISLWQGDNISVGKGGLVSRAGVGGVNLKFKGGSGKGGGVAEGACVPWKPRIVDERAAGSSTPVLKLYTNPGTVNGFLDSSWNNGISLPNDDVMRYIILNVLLTDGQVNSVSRNLVGSLPTASETNPQTKNAIPSSIKILMGTVQGSSTCMLHDKNLTVVPYKSYLEFITGAVPVGQLPYYVYWGLKLEAVA